MITFPSLYTGFKVVLFLVVAQGLFAATPQSTQTANGLAITYAGADGTVEYDWVIPHAGSTNTLGTLAVKTGFSKLSKAEYDFSPVLQPTSGDLVFQNATWQSGPNGSQLVLNYSTAASASRIIVQLALNGKALQASFTASNACVRSLSIGSWPMSMPAINIPVTYYSGQIKYSQVANLFVNTYFDWRSSNSTGLSQTMDKAMYEPLTNGAFNSLQETLNFSISPVFSEVLPTLNNPTSTYVNKIGGTPVLDVWQGSFRDVADRVRSLTRFGIKNCIVLLHRWQRSGYDNALPAHAPGNSVLGGPAELAGVGQAAMEGGHMFGVHENYVDYYPNYDFFKYGDTLSTSAGNSLVSWLNPETKMNAYATKPSRFVTNAQSQSPLIHSAYSTSASYVDVNSALMPFDRADMDANQTGAGMYLHYANASKALWSFERATHNGPVFGEGRNHWYWSGYLDGVQAQTGTGEVPENMGTHLPMLLDFDLTVMHPLQVNHGMGLYERWVAPGDDFSRTDLQDAYRMQEVLFGHAPYVGGDYWSLVPKILVEQNLVGTIAKRYAGQTVSQILYQFKGNWTDSTTAAKSSDWSRPQVRYTNGDTIVANSQAAQMSWQGYTLPQYGWLAQGNGVLAYTALRSGHVVDYAETPNLIFANARNQADMAAAPTFAQPLVTGFQQTASNSFSVQLQWHVFDYSTTDSYATFVHIVDPANPKRMVLQCDHMPYPGVDTWKPGQIVPDSLDCTVPASVPDGTYTYLAGLYSMTYGTRFRLLANDFDGDQRYQLGQLQISNGGKTIRFAAAAPLMLVPDTRLNPTGSVIDFDNVRTDGMVWLSQDTAGWTLRTYPQYRNVVVQVKASKIQQPSKLSCDAGQPQVGTGPVITLLPGGFWSVAMNGAQECHWTN